MSKQAFPEHLMHRVWQGHKEYLVESPVLADQTQIQILDAGMKNEHRGGPDFLGARLAMNGLVVTGDVELHRSLDLWDEHGHDSDNRYSSVVLHVVLHPEEENSTAPKLPTLALSENLALDRGALWSHLFEEIYDRTPELPCFPHNIRLPMRFKRKVVDHFGETRLDNLVSRFDPTRNQASFIDAVYAQTFDALGYSENRKPFLELARLLPIENLRKLVEITRTDSRSITFEAAFFGMAGLLPIPSASFSVETNERLIELASRWAWIKEELQISETLAEHDWAFFRIRPLNTPYRRVALAAYLAEHIFSRASPENSELFPNNEIDVPLGANSFWERRTSYASELTEPQSLLGHERASAILLNVILPAKLASIGQSGVRLKDVALRLRQEWGETHSQSSAHYLNVVRQELLESESVKTVRFEQGALKLTREFCFARRCSECPIGQRLQDRGWKPPGSSMR